MIIPRNKTLAEALYRDIDEDEYLQRIYDSLLMNYTNKIFQIDSDFRNIPIKDALRFADLLSKSTYAPTADRDRLWAQEIVILLQILYPNDPRIQYYLGSVLSSVGNYRGLYSNGIKGYKSVNLLDQIFYEYDKDEHKIPGKDSEYFFDDQLRVYRGINNKYFSYSGPTSMGKSFVVQTYIQQRIENGSNENFAILVPTKALINEVRSNFIESLQTKLEDKNYRVVTSIGDILLKQKHHFIFVMTPERMLYMLIEQHNIKIDFLFIDEAHKISERGGRSAYYYKVLSQLEAVQGMPTTIFASPNIPNPDIYLNIIPDASKEQMHKLTSKFAPVCQFKFYIDLINHSVYCHNDYKKELEYCFSVSQTCKFEDIIGKIGQNKQNLIYCSSRQKAMDYAIRYAKNITSLNNPKLNKLADEIRKEVHSECYLGNLIERGIAYHVGYLPSNIRLRIERSFEEGELRTIFCTSTLVEGVNLPADNLFITSYKDGLSNMDEVEFRNLAGRVGRIKYNLYGNVFLVRLEEQLKENKFEELLNKDVPEQKLSIDIKENTRHIHALIADLASGNIELSEVHRDATETDYEAIRKFGLILTRDLSVGKETPLMSKLEPYLTQEQKSQICYNFPSEKTNDDITLSFDQEKNLHDEIENGLAYPELKGDNDDIDFNLLLDFLKKLREIFKWEIYEKETIGRIGKKDRYSVLRWYAVILLRWIRGNGISTLVYYGIRFKEENPETGVWSGGHEVAEMYDKNSIYHKNLVIAESLSAIENVLLYKISMYFRKFSIEYKAFNNKDHYDNDWYDFVEYGTSNALTIFLQQNGFSRESAIFIERPENLTKYVTLVDGVGKIKRSIFECGNIGVETEAQDIQFNVPELFVDK